MSFVITPEKFVRVWRPPQGLPLVVEKGLRGVVSKGEEGEPSWRWCAFVVTPTSQNSDIASLQGSEHRHTSSSLGVVIIPNPNSLLVVNCLLVFTCIILCLLTHILLVLVYLA